ncbi:hypothetical protein L6452_24663 [Arctium lappa]|uniref:Uncharacterized protein n=1 Tax=Arctium lappa TaxID=4217 RepID=A0ACB9A9X4_ARCLA|nr:hypothetical protein L6452_24663 [Arctium lappa]
MYHYHMGNREGDRRSATGGGSARLSYSTFITQPVVDLQGTMPTSTPLFGLHTLRATSVPLVMILRLSSEIYLSWVILSKVDWIPFWQTLLEFQPHSVVVLKKRVLTNSFELYNIQDE